VRTPTLEQMRMVLDLSPVPTALLQWDQLQYLNPAAIELLGGDGAEELFLRQVLGWNHPDQREEDRRKQIKEWTRQPEQISLAQKNWARRNGRWIRQSGDALLLEVRATPIPLNGGNGVQITFPRIAASQQAAFERHEQLQLALETGRIGIWDMDPRTGEIHWSNRCHEIFGIEDEEHTDYADFLSKVHTEDRDRVDRAVQNSLRPGGTGEYGADYRILYPNGEVRWIAAVGRAFFTQVDGRSLATRMIGIALDITRLRQTDASVSQNEKLNVTGRLAASIAHEINNPLEAITNLLYLLHEGPLEEEQRRYIRLAQQELARVTDITVQALRFYRDPSAPVQCNIAEIIDSALTLMGGRFLASHIQVERRYSRGATVFGAREELRQVIVNLVHNAMDAMPHGGRLLARTKITTHWRSGRAGVCITIADTGHGMDRPTMQRMFEPFFTTRAAVGTGLGLWLCTGIVEKHGGTIRVKSCQNPIRTGTVVTIFLPFDRRK
jgi:PAS domain S-box-containing protein